MEKSDPENKSAYKIVIFFTVISMLISAVIAIAATFLLLGLFKKNARYLLVWIYTAISLIALNIILSVVLVFFGNPFMITSAVIYFVITTYFILAVNTHRQELVNGMDTNS